MHFEYALWHFFGFWYAPREPFSPGLLSDHAKLYLRNALALQRFLADKTLPRFDSRLVDMQQFSRGLPHLAEYSSVERLIQQLAVPGGATITCIFGVYCWQHYTSGEFIVSRLGCNLPKIAAEYCASDLTCSSPWGRAFRSPQSSLVP